MLDLKLDRPPTAPKDAATVILVRDSDDGVQVFCVERSKQSRFLGGAIVFPGGKLDGSDAAWPADLTTNTRASLIAPSRATEPFARDEAHFRSLAIAAARETLEEAALLHVITATNAKPTLEDADLFALRTRLTTDPNALRDYLASHDLKLNLEALYPIARWVTPIAESRRYDARFFVAVAPEGQTGAHDEHETMASFWATPDDVLRRWEKGEVQVAPPTHSTIALLAGCEKTTHVLELAETTSLDPICPRLVQQVGSDSQPTLALTLPGDPEHEIKDRRTRGPSRYVLRGDRWLAEDAPT